MLLRIGLLLLGIVEIVAPRPLVDFWMRLAVAGDGDVELRPWVYAAARIEGALILLWLLARRRRRTRTA